MRKINIEDKIIFENNHYIVLVKDEGILSQEDSSGDPDMVNLLKDYLKEKYQKPGNVYVGLIHRLDRRVLGLMVFGKTSKGSSRISEAIRNKEFKKTYLAIVKGRISGSKTLVNKLEKSDNKSFKAIESNDGKESILEYNVIKNIKIDNTDFSILKINLLTGRFNQIRSQLSINGTPIINDFKYGYDGKNYDDHLGLFCIELAFPDPVTKEIEDYKISKDYLPFKEYINYEDIL